MADEPEACAVAEGGPIVVIPPVTTEAPPGQRACGGQGGNSWVFARGSSGAQPFRIDYERLKTRFPSDESRALYIDHVREHFEWAADGQLPWDLVVQMRISPAVLEIKLPDWWFSGGKMHVRLYYSEPKTLPGHLVALRLLAKRPGPIGVSDQDGHATSASKVLSEYQVRGYQ